MRPTHKRTDLHNVSHAAWAKFGPERCRAASVYAHAAQPRAGLLSAIIRVCFLRHDVAADRGYRINRRGNGWVRSDAAARRTAGHPSTGRDGKISAVHAAAGDLAKKAPEILANPEAARGLEQTLIEAMVACLAHGDGRESSSARGQHAIVMRRFRRVVEENPEQPLYIPEICKAIRVPDRTLRMCCEEYLGMGPKRYLLLRRMHLARRALRQAESDATSVTEIATQFGFWQLGRFAVEYQSLFGESPSATLHRQPG
jgi:AraC-like DNA-binding protein